MHDRWTAKQTDRVKQSRLTSTFSEIGNNKFKSIINSILCLDRQVIPPSIQTFYTH